jgi:hypothetical protein
MLKMEKNIEVLSMPGLSVNLRQAGDILELTASGTLKAAFSPILKMINSRLREEKPALVLEDSNCFCVAPPNTKSCF